MSASDGAWWQWLIGLLLSVGGVALGHTHRRIARLEAAQAQAARDASERRRDIYRRLDAMLLEFHEARVEAARTVATKEDVRALETNLRSHITDVLREQGRR